jgi:uncharacterized damage-inducible protein DinB
VPKDILLDLLRGRGSHVDPVAVVDGLTAELAGRPLPGAQHTIWQLVWHMNYWMEYELRSLAGPEVPYPEGAAESWPAASSPSDEAEWRDEVVRFRRQVEAFAAWGRRVALDAALDQPVHPAQGERVSDVLWQMVAHNSYHAGQVALIRRAFGAWPPAGGGDTW